MRGLSLGERMKCELAASLLHRPQVLFLDEPTLGVDVTMQTRIRQFVQQHNARHGATILLTSHYMADVTALCKRVIVIHKGTLLYDGALADLTDKIAPFKLVTPGSGGRGGRQTRRAVWRSDGAAGHKGNIAPGPCRYLAGRGPPARRTARSGPYGGRPIHRERSSSRYFKKPGKSSN